MCQITLDLIKQFCSTISRRIISNTQYIQGDVSLKFGSYNHYSWIYQFVIPELAFFGCQISFSLFLLMHLKNINIIKFSQEDRQAICLTNKMNKVTLGNKSNQKKKTIIILEMTILNPIYYQKHLQWDL